MTDDRHRHRRHRASSPSILARAIAGLPILAASTGVAAAETPPPPASDSVATIVVQGQKLNVESKIDRKIYTVPEDALGSVGTLSDVLSVVPSIDIDPDGILSLRGDTHVLVLIDGKPATQLQGSKAGDTLQSISAMDIERIEVMTTPPVQYKSEGTAGVINIITRKRTQKETTSGSLQGSLGDGGRSLVGANGHYGGKTFTASLGTSYRSDYRQRTTRSDTIGLDPATHQVLQSRDYISEHARRNIPSVNLSGEFTPNDRQALSASTSWTRRGGPRTYTQLDETTLPSGAVSSSTQRLSVGHDPGADYNGTLRFTQKLNQPDETLDVSLHRSISHQRERYDYTNDSFVPPTDTFYNNLSFTEDQGATEADVDYSLPLAKTQSLKLGYSFEQDDYGFNNIGANVDPASGLDTINPVLTDDFRFRQQVNGFYQSYQGSFNTWAVLAGLRTEWTTTDAILRTTGSSTRTQYLRLYPSIRIDRILSDQSTLSFGAARRVTRPDPANLNPYLDYEFAPNLRAGNSHLAPQFTQSFDLGYNFEQRGTSYGLTAYYRHNKNSVTEVTEYLGGNQSLTTKANLPKDNSAGLEFSATGRLLSKLTYSLSGTAFYSQIDGTALGATGLKSTTGVNLKTKLDYRPTVRDSAQLTFTRSDKRLTPQGSISAINIVNLGYKHSFTPVLSAVGLVSDLFSGQRSRRVVSTPSLTRVYERDVEGRIIFVGLTYSFGGSSKEKPSNFEYDSGS
jgi:outer membrane receptor for ferrienterochelin and colicin